MKDNESRDLMVKRVKETFEKYPAFISLPEVNRTDGPLESALPGLEQHHYVSALHAICANGEVIGRHGNVVIGKFVNIGTTSLQGAISPTPGRKLKAESR